MKMYLQLNYLMIKYIHSSKFLSLTVRPLPYLTTLGFLSGFCSVFAVFLLVTFIHGGPLRQHFCHHVDKTEAPIMANQMNPSPVWSLRVQLALLTARDLCKLDFGVADISRIFKHRVWTWTLQSIVYLLAYCVSYLWITYIIWPHFLLCLGGSSFCYFLTLLFYWIMEFFPLHIALVCHWFTSCLFSVVPLDCPRFSPLTMTSTSSLLKLHYTLPTRRKYGLTVEKMPYWHQTPQHHPTPRLSSIAPTPNLSIQCRHCII